MKFRSREMKIERSPEEMQRVAEIRERFQRERPTAEELAASGEYDPPIPQSDYWDFVEMLIELRAARQAAGLSREDLAERMAVNLDYVAQLEAGRTSLDLSMLRRYAAALGKQIIFCVSDLPASGTLTESNS
ncbi:MAG TPA: helix-turn-helix transcriptional regulator [Pirellulales bacterium]|nr:helix-turn-helix transcriptional regulator [Pirellulales bacterium]